MNSKRSRFGVGLNRSGDYHTQRNNAVDSSGTCNVTSYVMAAKRAGCVWSYVDGEQPEDMFARFLCSKAGLVRLRRVASWAFGGDGTLRYKPYEVHALLAWGYKTALLAGMGVRSFVWVGLLPRLCAWCGRGSQW